MVQALASFQVGATPNDIWVVVVDDDGNRVDPTGLVCSLGFKYQLAWDEFAGEVVTLDDLPYVHLTIPASYRANLTNREFSIRVTIDGVVYQAWSWRLAF